jgi:hypothetical protein
MINTCPALDSSIVPIGELDLPTIAANGLVSIVIPRGAKILVVQGDAAFVEGQLPPNTSSNPIRQANQIYNIPVAGRTAWSFAPVSGTVNLRFKLLLG